MLELMLIIPIYMIYSRVCWVSLMSSFYALNTTSTVDGEKLQ
jgi:hypothetical protein